MENKVLSIYSLSFFKDYINKVLDFHVRVRAFEKRVSGKQPLQNIFDEICSKFELDQGKKFVQWMCFCMIFSYLNYKNIGLFPNVRYYDQVGKFLNSNVGQQRFFMEESMVRSKF